MQHDPRCPTREDADVLAELLDACRWCELIAEVRMETAVSAYRWGQYDAMKVTGGTG